MPFVKNKSKYEKTSFLNKSNSAFIESMYLKYVKNDSDLPLSWKEYFDDLGDQKQDVLNEIIGPSWSPQKKKISKIIDDSKKELEKNEYEISNGFGISNEDYEKEKEQSVKAIALIRAYRIRGHLIANLDPLNLMERKYLDELHPSDHGFKKEDYNKKIYLKEYLDKKYSTII